MGDARKARPPVVKELPQVTKPPGPGSTCFVVGGQKMSIFCPREAWPVKRALMYHPARYENL
jgi:hypothetical protein